MRTLNVALLIALALLAAVAVLRAGNDANPVAGRDKDAWKHGSSQSPIARGQVPVAKPELPALVTEESDAPLSPWWTNGRPLTDF